MKHSDKLLKDTVGVVLIDKPIKSSILEIPESVSQNTVSVVTAKIVMIGSKFRYKNDVKKGTKVLVPNQFGTRMENNLVIYDGEDVLAIVND